MTEPRSSVLNPITGIKRSSYIQNAIPNSEQGPLITSAYGVIGQMNHEKRLSRIMDTELIKDKTRLTYDEKPPNNDIRVLTRPKQIRLVKLDLDSPRM